MRKRIIAIILFSAMLCATLISCTNSQKETNETDYNLETKAEDTGNQDVDPSVDDSSAAGDVATFQAWYFNPLSDNASHILVLDDHLTYRFIDGQQSIAGYSVIRVSNGVHDDADCLDMNGEPYTALVESVLYDYTYQAAFIASNCMDVYENESAYTAGIEKLIHTLRSYQPNIKIVFENFSLYDLSDTFFNMLQKNDCDYWDCRIGYTADDFAEDVRAYLAPNEIQALSPEEKPEGSFDETLMGKGREATCEWLIGVIHDVYQKKDKPRILIIGDSICWGYHNDVQAAMGDDYYVDVLTLSFDSADPAVMRGISIPLNTYNYDIIHFNLGIHTSRHEDETGYYNNIYNILSYLKSTYPQSRIVYTTSTTVTLNNSPTEWMTERNEEGQRAARELGLLVDDLYTLVIEEKPPKGDQYHFDDQTVIAKHIATMLLDILAGEYD